MEDLSKIIHNSLIEAWELLIQGYNKSLLVREWTLQSAMYYHLRKALSSCIDWWSLRIWCEYPILKWDTDASARIDMAIVDFNQSKNEKWLEMTLCVDQIYALIEFKYAYTEKKVTLFTKPNKKGISDKKKLKSLSSILYPHSFEDIKDSWENRTPKYKYFFGINEYMKFWKLSYSFESKCSENNGKFMDLKK